MKYCMVCLFGEMNVWVIFLNFLDFSICGGILKFVIDGCDVLLFIVIRKVDVWFSLMFMFLVWLISIWMLFVI